MDMMFLLVGASESDSPALVVRAVRARTPVLSRSPDGKLKRDTSFG
jgi:hypothetical protein